MVKVSATKARTGLWPHARPPARCECLVSIYEKEMTLEEFDSLGYAELERLAAKTANDCL